MRASNGEIVEVFEWKSEATQTAHEHPEVQSLWARYAEVCDYGTLSSLAEGDAPFAQFEPLDLG